MNFNSLLFLTLATGIAVTCYGQSGTAKVPTVFDECMGSSGMFDSLAGPGGFGVDTSSIEGLLFSTLQIMYDASICSVKDAYVSCVRSSLPSSTYDVDLMLKSVVNMTAFEAVLNQICDGDMYTIYTLVDSCTNNYVSIGNSCLNVTYASESAFCGTTMKSLLRCLNMTCLYYTIMEGFMIPVFTPSCQSLMLGTEDTFMTSQTVQTTTIEIPSATSYEVDSTLLPTETASLPTTDYEMSVTTIDPSHTVTETSLLVTGSAVVQTQESLLETSASLESSMLMASGQTMTETLSTAEMTESLGAMSTEALPSVMTSTIVETLTLTSGIESNLPTETSLTEVSSMGSNSIDITASSVSSTVTAASSASTRLSGTTDVTTTTISATTASTTGTTTTTTTTPITTTTTSATSTTTSTTPTTTSTTTSTTATESNRNDNSGSRFRSNLIHALTLSVIALVAAHKRCY